MAGDRKLDGETAARLLAVKNALLEGRLNVGPQVQELARELMQAPLTMMGLVDVRGVSERAIAFGRNAGMALTIMAHEKRESPKPTLRASDAQSELFIRYRQLFSGLVGRAVELVSSPKEIQELMAWRATHEFEVMVNAANAAAMDLATFYEANATDMFQQAQSFGGMRLVTGGQRAFGPSALNAVRITGLYADTQLIPDPIYPFLSSDLHLTAKHLQLAIALFFVLQLRPLVDLQLPVPPVYVFPSFEQSLEEEDPFTKFEFELLALRMLGPACRGSVSSLEDLFDYAKKDSDRFASALLEHKLFVPPGKDPDERVSVEQAVVAYLQAIERTRASNIVEGMKKLSKGVLLLSGTLERLRPQYHLLENANELDAQPLLSQPVQWHYFEKCAEANALDLRREKILSEQAFTTVRAIQDDSLSWLANIPVATLAELVRRGEHRWLRDELNKYSAQLASANAADTDAMVRELSHGLASLTQRQHAAMAEIEKKYSPKKIATQVGAGAGLVVAAAASFLPMLAPLLPVGAPAAAAAAAVLGGAIGYGKEKAGEVVEKRHAKRSMLGVLAIARSQHHEIR